MTVQVHMSLLIGFHVLLHNSLHLLSGHNQTLELLGDTVLQLIATVYLFKHFPDHHEGHLTVSDERQMKNII